MPRISRRKRKIATRMYVVHITKRLGRVATVPSTMYIEAPTETKARAIALRKPSTVSVNSISEQVEL